MKPVKLRMSWHGDGEPTVGHYMFTARGRICYLILEKRVPLRSTWYSFLLMCERRPRAEMQEAPAWEFIWHKRK